ncbi:MAG: flagellin [Pseudomonadota bacterium]
MSFLSIGDLAQTFQLRRDSARIDSTIQRLTQELSSGLRTDLVGVTSGDFGPLSGIERDLSALTSYELAAKEAALVGEAGNAALGRIKDDADTLTSTLLLTQTAGQAAVLDNAAADARNRFENAVSALNTEVAGRSVFSGQAYGTSPLPDAQDILDDLFAAVSTETTVADALAAIDAWFAPGGDFETTIYRGSLAEAAPVRLGRGDTAQPSVTVLDPGVTGTLSALASAALLDEGLFAGQTDLRRDFAGTIAERLLTSIEDLTESRARIGDGQGLVEATQASISAERSSLELARAEIVAADPYEVAVLLREAETQLQTLYTLTGRLSSLSLVNYLR